MYTTTTQNPENLNDLATPEVKSTAQLVLQNWKLAILTTDSLHLAALKRTREQIERVEGVSISRIWGCYVSGKYLGAYASIPRSGEGEDYYARLYANGHAVCNCADFTYRRRYCKHLVRLAIAILDENPRGEIYVN